METPPLSEIKNVTIIGAGILGAQIAVQTACFGFDVCVYDNAEGAFERSAAQFEAIMTARNTGPVVPMELWNESILKVRTQQVLTDALKDAHLVIEAVLESARLRLRPIMMTTATTVLGMLPLAIGGGAGGEIQAALARAVIGGLTVSTLITLVVIPAAYTGVHGLMARVRGRSDTLTS